MKRMQVARIGLLVALLGVGIFEAFALRGRGVHNNDFRHVWLGAWVMAHHPTRNPYDDEMMDALAQRFGMTEPGRGINPYVYLPATGLALRPLAELNFTAPTPGGVSAESVWFWFNIALAWACVLTGPWWMRVERRWIASVAGAAFLVGAMPFLRQMTAGQLNVALLAMLILSLGLMSRGFAIGGGVVLGVAAAFKISPLFSIVLLAAMRRRRAAIAASVAFGAILVVSIAAVGLDVHLDFLPVLRDMGYGRSTGGALFFRDHYNQSFNSLFHHLYAPNAIEVPPDGHRPLIDLGIGFGAAVANVFTFMASAAILSLLCILLWRRGAPPTDGRWSDADDALFHVGVLAMLLLPSLMWDHYAVQALAAMMALFGATATLSSKARATVAVVAFALLAIPVAHADPRWMTGLGRAVMFVRLWGMILMFALMALEAKRRIDARKAIC